MPCSVFLLGGGGVAASFLLRWMDHATLSYDLFGIIMHRALSRGVMFLPGSLGSRFLMLNINLHLSYTAILSSSAHAMYHVCTFFNILSNDHGKHANSF